MAEFDTLGEVQAADTPDAAALYIASLTHDLAQLARRHGLDSLEYILEMARLEADQIARNSGSI